MGHVEAEKPAIRSFVAGDRCFAPLAPEPLAVFERQRQSGRRNAREIAYLDVEKETHWKQACYLAATAKDPSHGKTGVKMSAPTNTFPNYWTHRTKRRRGWSTETRPGPVFLLSRTKTVIPETSVGPLTILEFHVRRGQFQTSQLFDAREKRYGEAKSAADFAGNRKPMATKAARHVRAYGRNKYKSTGLIQWMLNNAWARPFWHLDITICVPRADIFGSNQSLDRWHVAIFRRDDRTVAVVQRNTSRS